MRPDEVAPVAGRARPGCPVCGYPIAHEELRCAECRWTLHGEWRLGAPGATLLRDFEERLAAARRERDLLAVVRAGLADDAYVRGGTPAPEEWVRARQAVDVPPVSDAALQGALAAALHRMRPGVALTIAEVGADAALAVTRLELDGLGVPRATAEESVLTWADALPMLSGEPNERWFQLAGGLAELDRDALWRTLRDGLPQRLGEQGDDVLLVHREIGWPVPDRAVRVLRKRHPAAEVVPAGRLGVRDLLAPLVAALPIRHEVGLLAVEIEAGTRRVLPRLIPLFAPGALAGTEHAVPLARPPGDADWTVLAAVAAVPDRWTLLAASAARLPADAPTEVRVVLDAPGRVRVTAPDGLRPVTERLPELLDALPERLEVLTEPVDLICAVELGGVDETVARRLDLLRELVSVLDVTYPGSDLVRVAVLGYRDHAYGRGRERRQTVFGDWFGTPVKAIEALGRLRPSRIEYPEAAPVEDLLHEISVRLGRPRSSTGPIATGANHTGPMSTGSIATGQFAAGQFSTGQFSTGQFSTGQFSAGQSSTGQFSTGQSGTGPFTTGMIPGGLARGAPPRDARTVLLTVGARPPHPPVESGLDVLPCQFERGWQAGVAALRRAAVTCAAVLPADAPRDHPVWAALGAAGVHDVHDTDARRLGVGLGLLPAVPQLLNLPLADPERGAR
ncbi:hypothetical protein [Actinomadura roseirufa]|uniref:hypothetical protein n=1 Tax=Actinomadura roseirufa TaxID=2094049 RepID=UPI001041740E|nr:hypothetical protein [Actinomadura roseirufa]